MRIAGVVIGLLATLAGMVWVAQGLNLPFAPGSFMTADPAWVVTGAITGVVGLALAAWAWRQPRL